jgi:hypothetical protein
MVYRPAPWWKSWVFLLSIIFAGVVVNLCIKTPNVVGGGAGMMVGILLLAVIFKVGIEFILGKWQRRRDEKRHS